VGLRDTIKKSGLLDTYRKHVFYDYSVVTKAMFYGLELSATNADKFEVISRLPVQINPNNLTEIANSKTSPEQSILAGNKASYATKHKPPQKKQPEKKRFSIRLDYDIYDEYGSMIGYMRKQQDGMMYKYDRYGVCTGYIREDASGRKTEYDNYGRCIGYLN